MGHNTERYAKARGELHAAVFHLREAREAINATENAPESLNRFYLGAVMTQIELLQEVINKAEGEERKCLLQSLRHDGPTP